MKKLYIIGTLIIATIAGALYFFSGKSSNAPLTLSPQTPIPRETQKILENTSLKDNKNLSIMIIGDYGTGLEPEMAVSKQFNLIAEQEKADFVLGVGDNFYLPDGVTGVDDPNWDSKWANVYQTKSYLKDLTWYGSIGNHDFNGSDLFAEFKYNKYNWVIKDFFYTHTEVVNGQKIAFVHVDTNFLAYGIEGEPSKPLMKPYFKQLGWTNNQQMLDYAEEQLKAIEGYDWIVAMAHHQVGYSCPKVLNTHLFYDLFNKYNVSVYMSGHSHTLSYDNSSDMGIILSGAGSYAVSNECAEANPYWSIGHHYGFMNVKIHEEYMKVKAYYVHKDHILQPEGHWKEIDLPYFNRRKTVPKQKQQEEAY